MHPIGHAPSASMRDCSVWCVCSTHPYCDWKLKIIIEQFGCDSILFREAIRKNPAFLNRFGCFYRCSKNCLSLFTGVPCQLHSLSVLFADNSLCTFVNSTRCHTSVSEVLGGDDDDHTERIGATEVNLIILFRFFRKTLWVIFMPYLVLGWPRWSWPSHRPISIEWRGTTCCFWLVTVN